MTRLNPVAGPGGVLSVLTLTWFAAGGVALAWLATPGPLSEFRAVARLLTGG